jgi:mRNA interferase MazF
MMDRDAELKAGDVVLVDFSPVRGHEQDGTRPALVITDEAYNRASSFVVICPITSNANPWPFKVALPDGSRVKGFIMVDQIKSVDRRRRVLRVLDRLPVSCMNRVHVCLSFLLGLKPNHADH